MKLNDTTFLPADLKVAQLGALIQVLALKLRYDPDYEFTDADPDEEKDFSEYRKQLGHLLKLVARINVEMVASFVRSAIQTVAQSQPNTMPWIQVEVSLHLMQLLAEAVSGMNE
jgi:hypothetical protein